jgi:drug/metabolite transporter (DMT)-like permease
MSRYRIYLLMILAAVFWSGAFITGKIAVREFPAFSLTFFRFLIALPFIFAILARSQPGGVIPQRHQWPPLILLGTVGTFFYHALFFSSLKYTTAVNSSLIGSTLPMITALLAAVFIGEKITRRRSFGIATAFGGILLVVTDGAWSIISGLKFNSGDGLMFLAVWCWAVYSILSRIVMARYDISPIAVTAYTFLVCTVVSIPFAIWENPLGYLPGTTVAGWLSVGYMAVFASVLGYLIQLLAVQKIGAAKAAIFVNLVPAFTIVQSVLFLGETVSIFKLGSGLIIFAGVYLATRPEEAAKASAVAAECPAKT